MIENRNSSRTVCVTQSPGDEFPLNTEQPVKMIWLEVNMPDEMTRFTFTYKPDPRVESIHPDVTIPRYASAQGKFMNISKNLQ